MRFSVCLTFCLSLFKSKCTAQLCRRNKKKKGGGGIKAVLSSGYAKSAEDSICKPGLVVQTMHDYISGLHAFPCPLFPIFPGEKIMWLGCVILLKLHTPEIAAVVCCLFAYLPALGEKCVGIRGCVCFRGH